MFYNFFASDVSTLGPCVWFQEDCTPENVWNMGGLSILTSAPLMPPYVCYLCASKGQHEVTVFDELMKRRWDCVGSGNENALCHSAILQMLFCQVCCEPFHPFCLEPAERPSDENKENWCCRRCKFCRVCGRKSKHSKVQSDYSQARSVLFSTR